MGMIAVLFVVLLIEKVQLCAQDPKLTHSGSTTVEVDEHKFSVLFTAQDVNKYLSSEDGIEAAMNWCFHYNIKKVYIETWRAGYAKNEYLISARDAFLDNGFDVEGCVATVEIGKPSTNWNLANCYTNQTTQTQLKEIFQYTASIFDKIIIDDFFFTDCECDECHLAKKAQNITVFGTVVSHYENYPDFSCYHTSCPWWNYRTNLMTQVSKHVVLDAVLGVNPKAIVTLKYPDWYDMYQDFGYDTASQTAMFPKIWVGTESRNYEDDDKPPYFGFVIMRWLGEVGGDKCGGGWYDPFNCTPQVYVEQARMTIAGGAKESLLFEYGVLMDGPGKVNLDALLPNMPELTAISSEVRKRNISGVATFKPLNSHGGCIVDPEDSHECMGEDYIMDFVGMLGIPILPLTIFPDPKQYKSAFFSTYILKEVGSLKLLSNYIASGNPTLVTDKLKQIAGSEVDFNKPNVFVLDVLENPKQLLSNPPEDLPTLRNQLLQPLSISFSAPVNTSLLPFTDGSWIIHNFGDQPANVDLNGKSLSLSPHSWIYHWIID
eukprot:TRINITY_DN14800_c0_g1_i1.p1 TRINITY_DN14800_c0_g1~~TRINITY_DN14800_c0_g1_i1.p1  ORF type:complete len:546 (-),score=139.68 TRINITY_DN14800_c0_g1_i1:21-1658(-)